MTKFIFLFLFTFFTACKSGSRQSESYKNIKLITPAGEEIQTTLAISPKEQEQGLSGVKPDDFQENQGMLFFYLYEDERHFWMPDTYFDLDLFFLDKSLRITDVIRKLPFYVGRSNPEYIPRARGVWSRHVLEMKSTSEISKKLNVGDTLKWKAEMSLEETEKFVREEKKNY